MKRLATKAVLTPHLLTADERAIIYRTETVFRELRFVDHVLDDRFFDRPLYGIEAGWREVFARVYEEFRTVVGREESFQVCREALRECVLKNRHRKLESVYRACERRHRERFPTARVTNSRPTRRQVDAQ